MSVGPTRVLACALMAAALMAPVIDGGAIVRAQAGQANQTNQATPNAQGATSPGSAQPGQAPGAAPQTPEQQVAAALGVRGSAKAVQRQVANMLDEARRQRDIIRVTCLDDKLTQVDANFRTLEDRLNALQEAVKNRDDAQRDHELTVIEVLRQRFETLAAEARRCVGQDIYETGATRVTTEVCPYVPDFIPDYIPPIPPLPVPFVPPPGSGVN